MPVIQFALSGDVEYALLYDTALEIIDRLESIDGVSGVTQIGLRDRRLVVEVSRDKLEPLGLNIDAIARAIRAETGIVPGGTLKGRDRDWLLRTVESIDDNHELNDVIVRSTPNGITRVGDMATVREEFDPDVGFARYNGQQAIVLQITKIPRTNSVDIVNTARQTIDDFSNRIPVGIETEFFNDTTTVIRDSIQVLTRNALLGFALVLLLLYLFIGLRNSLITALGIPITFALSFIILNAMGQTLNGNTLFGLVLSLGLIVDHAIVIVENSYRQQSLGLSRRDAAIVGVDQVIIPVGAATLTTVAAFLPLAFLPGIIGRFLSVVPITVSIALIVSTIEAGYFIPAHFAEWPGGRQPKVDGGLYIRFREWFGRVLAALYRRRGITAIAVIIIMVLAFSLIGLVGQELFAAEDVPYGYIDITMPVGTPIEKTDAITRRFEERLLPRIGDGEIEGIVTFVGFSGCRHAGGRKHLGIPDFSRCDHIEGWAHSLDRRDFRRDAHRDGGYRRSGERDLSYGADRPPHRQAGCLSAAR